MDTVVHGKGLWIIQKNRTVTRRNQSDNETTEVANLQRYQNTQLADNVDMEAHIRVMMRAPETNIVKATNGHEKTRREVTQGNLNLEEALQGIDVNRVEVHRQAVTIVAMVDLE